jgi:hypothetical protein
MLLTVTRSISCSISSIKINRDSLLKAFLSFFLAYSVFHLLFPAEAGQALQGEKLQDESFAIFGVNGFQINIKEKGTRDEKYETLL